MAIDVEVISTRWQQHETELNALRRTVFIEEQQVPELEEWDTNDARCDHFLARLSHGEAVACARLTETEQANCGQIGRMAVLPEYRRQGIGAKLLHNIERFALQQGLTELVLNAQDHAVDWYQRQGYECCGERYMEVDIEHQPMRRLLDASAIQQRLDNAILGQTYGQQPIHSWSQWRSALLNLCRQTRRYLHIYSPDLNAELWADHEVLATISSFARKSRYSEIRIIVDADLFNSSHLHPLIDLAQKLPSKIDVRLLSKADSEHGRESLVICDRVAYILAEDHQQPQACAEFYNRPSAESHQSQFDHWWNQASDDPNLRRMQL